MTEVVWLIVFVFALLAFKNWRHGFALCVMPVSWAIESNGWLLVAYMLANVAAFSVAARAYGDEFILLTLGWSFGFLVALPVLADAESKLTTAEPTSEVDRGFRPGVAR